MRIPALPLALLAVALAGCGGDLPTALSDTGPAALRAGSADAAILPFRGSLHEASHTRFFDPATNSGHIHLVGTGTATHLGRFTLVSDYALSPATISGPVSMTLTSANGDELFATGTAQGSPSEDGSSLNSVESLTITGGTGRFAGATGSFVLRQVDLAPDRFSSGSFAGTIRFPHLPQ